MAKKKIPRGRKDDSMEDLYQDGCLTSTGWKEIKGKKSRTQCARDMALRDTEACTMELKWYGPFTWYGEGDDCFFNTKNKEEVLNKKGIYLWSIPVKDKYLTYYVGETGRSFLSRFKEHTRSYLSGHYRIYDPQEFAKGNMGKPIWGGTWKKGPGDSNRQNPKYVLEFLDRYPELSLIIREFLGQLRIFIAPLKENSRIRKRIESAIVERLQTQKRLMEEKDSVDFTLRRKKKPEEESITITMTSPKPILGLPNELEV